jgi:hemolysin activation/secretion protein
MVTPFIPPEAPPPYIHHISTPRYGLAPLVVSSHGYHYTVIGNTLLPDQEIRHLLAGAITPEDAVNAINLAYHKAGYFLTAQRASVQGKEVSIQVVQGQITQENIAPGIAWFFTGLRQGTGLQSDDVIYRSVLANAYTQRNGQQIQMGFTPSTNPAGSTLEVHTSPIPGYSPLTGNIFFGNYGSRYSSRYLAGGSLSYNPGWGINISINGAQGLPGLTAASSGSQYTQGGLSASSITPFGIYGFNAQWTHYRIGKAAYPLNPTGNIFTWGLTGSQLVYANDHSRWSVSEAYTHVGNDVSVYQEVVPGGYPLTVQHYGYYSVGTQWNRSYNFFGKGGSVNTGFTYNQGISGSHGTLFNNAPGYPAARFHYFDANISWNQSLPLGISAIFNASGQGAFNTLPSQQQWILGGFGNLSAYYPGILAGDSGYSARFQLQSPAWRYKGFQLSSNLFAELGATTLTYLAPHTNPWQSLSDVGLGVNLTSPWGTSLTAMSAIPTGYNNVSKAIRRSSRIDAYFVLSQNF